MSYAEVDKPAQNYVLVRKPFWQPERKRIEASKQRVCLEERERFGRGCFWVWESLHGRELGFTVREGS